MECTGEKCSSIQVPPTLWRNHLPDVLAIRTPRAPIHRAERGDGRVSGRHTLHGGARDDGSGCEGWTISNHRKNCPDTRAPHPSTNPHPKPNYLPSIPCPSLKWALILEHYVDLYVGDNGDYLCRGISGVLVLPADLNYHLIYLFLF